MSNADLNALLDVTLDDIDDLPSFTNFPAGAHRALLTLSTKKIGDHPAIEAEFAYVEAIELTNENDVAPKAGDKCSVAFMMDNEFGAGKFKKVATPLAAAFNTNKVGEILEQAKSVEVVILTGLRKDKTDPTKEYMDIKELAVE